MTTDEIFIEREPEDIVALFDPDIVVIFEPDEIVCLFERTSDEG